jgi:UDP-GlcNAc:undecaprenyl-phosphate GlcNAc-1-phosphate transferase
MARNAHRVFLPDRGHLHHRLLEAGMSHRGAVLALYGCALATAVAALVLIVTNSLFLATLLSGSLTILTIAFLALIFVRARLARRRRDAAAVDAPPASPRSATSGGALGRH